MSVVDGDVAKIRGRATSRCENGWFPGNFHSIDEWVCFDKYDDGKAYPENQFSLLGEITKYSVKVVRRSFVIVNTLLCDM